MSHHRWLRRTVLGLTVALVAAAAPACSSGAATDDGGGTAQRTVTDAAGNEVEIPAHPERILALSEPTLDAALTLGANVVGTTSGRGLAGVSSYLADSAGDIPIVASVAGPNLEQVLNLHPDLILIDGTVAAPKPTLNKLEKIAPTVYVSDTGASWKQAFRATAKILNRTEQAAQFLKDFAARVSKVRSGLGKNADATVSIVRWGTNTPSVLLKELAASRVVSALGLQRPPSQNRVGEGHSQPISLENLDQLDADWMFFGTLGGSTNPSGGNSGKSAGVAASRAALQKAAAQTPGFDRLGVYQLGHIVPVDGSAWMSAGGPQAELVVLDDIEQALTTSS